MTGTWGWMVVLNAKGEKRMDAPAIRAWEDLEWTGESLRAGMDWHGPARASISQRRPVLRLLSSLVSTTTALIATRSVRSPLPDILPPYLPP